MPTRKERYSLKGGRAGYDRLAILARKYWPHTSALLDRVGLRSGMRFADLGCDGGRVSLEVAKRVGNQGQVVGIDIDPVSLDLARTAAQEQGLTNVTFRDQRVQEWNEPDAYDMVYTRALLQHLSDPVGVIRRMWHAVKPGGTIIVEDADHDGWFCHPPNPGFDTFRRVFLATIDRGGGDHAFGRKIYRAMTAAGVPPPTLALITLCYLEGDEKTLAWSSLDAVSDFAVKEGIATAAEVQSALDDLGKYTQDPTTLIGGPFYFQAYAHKPTG